MESFDKLGFSAVPCTRSMRDIACYSLVVISWSSQQITSACNLVALSSQPCSCAFTSLSHDVHHMNCSFAMYWIYASAFAHQVMHGDVFRRSIGLDLCPQWASSRIDGASSPQGPLSGCLEYRYLVHESWRLCFPTRTNMCRTSVHGCIF